MRATGIDCGNSAGVEERTGVARGERTGKNVKGEEMNRSAGGPGGPGGPGGGGKPPAPQKKSSQILTGILIGMVIGVAMAAVLAWYIVKSPSPFVQKERVIIRSPIEDVRSPIEVAKPITKAPELPSVAAVPGVDENKPRFEFYKVLTDKQEAAVPAKPAEKQPATKPQPAVSKTENKADTKVENKPDNKVNSKAEAKVDTKADAKVDVKADVKVDTRMDVKTDNKAIPAQGPYFLQAGSFSSAEDADKLKARLAMMGVEAYIQTATIPERGVWHRVRVGPYTNAEEMNHARNLLKDNNVDATPVRSQ